MARTAPVPNMVCIPGMNPCLWVMGGGGDGGGSGSGDGKGGKNKQGANGKNGGNDANGGGKCGGGTGGNCPVHQSNPAAGDPVEISSGRVYTIPHRDVRLGGPLQLEIVRQYSSFAIDRDVGLGFGWGHSLCYTAHVRRRSIRVTTPEGKSIHFEKPELSDGDFTMSADGWVLQPSGGGYDLDALDGLKRHLAPIEGGAPDELFLHSIRDRNGNVIELVYERGLLVQAIDSAQRRVVFRRNAQGRIASIEVKNADVQGRWISLVSYTYDDLGDLGIVTDADGYATRFEYEDHRLIEQRLPTGLVFHYRYLPDGRCFETWGDYPGATDPSLSADVPDTLADGVTKARGVHHVKIDFGNAGYVEAVDSVQVQRFFMNAAGYADKTVSGGSVTTRTFDGFGFLTSITDPTGAVTHYRRDHRGRLLMVTDPLGRTRTFVRDSRGLPTEITEPDGSVHKYEYDDRGNIVRRTDTLGRVTVFRYDARGLMIERVDPNGAIAKWTYDAQGNMLERIEPNGATWRYAHDALGRVVAIKNGLGAEVRAVYTDGSRPTAIHDADGTVVRFTYDGLKQLTELVNPNGGVVKYEYGGYGRLTATQLQNGETIRYFYNREGWLVDVKSPAGDSVRYEHTVDGLARSEETFDGRKLHFKRDLMGRVIAIDDGSGDLLELEYNPAGELVKQTLADGTALEMEYDLLGRPIAMRSGNDEFTLVRDAMGNIVRETQSVGGVTTTLEHAYDVTGERVRTQSSRGWLHEITRDPWGKRLQERLDGRHVTTHQLDAIGEEIARAFDGGGRLDLAFDLVGRLTDLRVASPYAAAPGAKPGEPAWMGAQGGASFERQFSWAPADDLMGVTDPLRKVTETFEWDARHRLLGRVRGNQPLENFRYDAAGNHSELKGRRVYRKGNVLEEKDGARYFWDAQGRLIEKHVPAPGTDIQVWKYEWTLANTLRSVRCPDHTRVDFDYDPIGRRTLKKVTRAVPGEKPEVLSVTRFVWDGDMLLHEIREKAAAEGDPIVEERTYAYPDARLAPWAQRVIERQGDTVRKNEVHYYVMDPTGAPMALVDSAGRVLCEMERTSFGEMTPAAGATTDTPFRLHGQYHDPEIALSYNRFRYYDPDAGRFVSADPIGLRGGELNLFGYGQNPITDVDPFGLHNANATLDGVDVPNTGNPSCGNNFPSGGWSRNPAAPNRDPYLVGLRDGGAGFGQLYRESHSEFKIMRELAGHHEGVNPALENSTLVINGESRSCPNCAAALDNFAKNNKMKIIYKAPGAEDLVMDYSHGRSSSNRASYSSNTVASY